MKVMDTNIYDVTNTIVIMGTCLKRMQPKAYDDLQKICNNIYELCLEETHVNMAITKIGGMLRTKKIKKIIFASVNKSPHCIQLHYIQDELLKLMNLEDVEIENYVAVDNELYPIDKETISLSKNLLKIKRLKEEK